MAKKRSKTITASSLYGNYSNFLQSYFKKIGAVPGDRIFIKKGQNEIEGNLLAQNELGDKNSILLKLDNGYNIGIKSTDEIIIEKREGSVELESFEIKIPKQKRGLPKISLLATGGTIASRIDYKTGGVVMAMSPQEIFANLPELFNEVSFKTIKSLFTMGSEDIYAKQWKKMAEDSYEELNNKSKGIVISHGTDTMHFTSSALSFMLQDLTSPVVITGAQRSSDRGSFDGAFNLISASRIAANADIASVMVCMHSSSQDDLCQLSRGTKVRKMHTSMRDAFKTINEEPLAYIDLEGKIRENQTNLPRRNDGEIKLNTNFEEKVALIKSFPGILPELVDFYIDRNIRGLIIEGTGLGHVPTFPPKDEENRDFMKALKRAIDENIFVGMTSQCIYGRVHPFVYRALRTGYQYGITYLEDMLPETAYVKLGWVLGNYTETKKVKEVMLSNLAGEYVSSLTYSEEM